MDSPLRRDRDRLGNPDCAGENVGPMTRVVHDFLRRSAITAFMSTVGQMTGQMARAARKAAISPAE